jgi:cyanophycinase
MKEQPINQCPVPNGILLMIGGKENKGEEPRTKVQKETSEPLSILRTFIELINKEKPKIAVVTTASSQGPTMFEEYKKAFSQIGEQTLEHIHHNVREEILNDDSAKQIQEVDAIFFTGGDQLKLTTLYGGTSFLLSLKQRYINDHLVIGGTSAGAMAMSTPMIYAGNEDVQQITGEIKITTGLEFLKDVCVDTHFVDRSRMIRMAQVIASNPTCIGVGLEEDTAVIIKNGIEAEVSGSGVLVLVEGDKITKSNTETAGKDGKHAVSIRNLVIHLLAKGNTFIIKQNNPPHI